MPTPEEPRATPADERTIEALSRHWNEAVAGNPGPTAGLDPGLAATVRRLQALGRAPAPDPAFAQQLWEDLMGQAQASGLEHVTMAGVPTLAPDVNGRREGATLPRAEGRAVRPRRWWQAVEVAAVAALIVALVGVYAALAHGPGLERLPVVGSLVERFQDEPANPWRSGGEFGGGGNLATLPAAPAVVNLLRATFTPDGRLEIPAGVSVWVDSPAGGLTVARGPEDEVRLKGNTLAGVEGPASLHNAGTTPVEALLVVVASGGVEFAPLSGVELEALAGGPADRLPGAEAYAVFGRAALGEGVELQAPPELTDTGSDGLALVWVESGEVRLVHESGTRWVRRADGGAGQTLEGPGDEPAALAAGDSALITDGAAFEVVGDGQGEARVVVFSLINLDRLTDATMVAALRGTPTSDARTVPGATPIAMGATPAVTDVFAEEIDPAECTTEPRPLAEIQALLATPVTGPREGEPGYTPEPTVESEDQLPQGPPADAATVAAIAEVERQFAACYNAGHVGAVLALLGDEAAREALGALLDDGPGTRSVADVLATPAAPIPAEERIALFPVRGVRELPDGRVGAIVEWGTPDYPPGVVYEANFHIYERIDGRWLIVEEIGSFNPDRQQGG